MNSTLARRMLRAVQLPDSSNLADYFLFDRIAAGERFDLILCDLMMPGVGGADFYERVAVAAPELVDRIVILNKNAPKTVSRSIGP